MTLIQPKYKHRRIKHSKNQRSLNKGGQSGSRYKKKHLLASGPPGTPRGVCVRDNPAYKHVRCQCGKHHTKGA